MSLPKPKINLPPTPAAAPPPATPGAENIALGGGRPLGAGLSGILGRLRLTRKKK